MDRRKHPRKEKPPDPRHAPLKARLGDFYQGLLGEQWEFDGSDGKALAELIASNPDQEIEARWSRGLRAEFHRVRRVRELKSKWGHHAAVGSGPPKDIRKGVTRAEDFDHSDQQVGPNGTIDIAF